MAARSVLASLRPRQWAHFALLPLAGVDPSLTAAATVPALARGVAVAACVLGYGYLLNALSDRGLDRDPRKNPLVGSTGPMVAHRIALLALAVAALALAATGPWPALAATLVALGSGTVYSVGPRLKGWPGICTLLNVGCFAPLLYVGLARAPIGAAQWALAGAFAGLLLQNQLVHEAADAVEDRAGGLRTTFLVAGPRGTAALVLLAGLGVAAASLALLSAGGAGLSVLLALHAAPYVTLVPWRVARDGSDPARMRRLRRVHRVGSAASGALLFSTMLLGG
jgi:4-hydroxybenzoate polyprenyltransferase